MKAALRESSITSRLDFEGNELKKERPVRSYDFGPEIRGKTLLLPPSEKGKEANWVEGVLLAIGEKIIDGMPRYEILPKIICHNGKITQASDAKSIYPPVNGTNGILGGKRCAVVTVEDIDSCFDSAGMSGQKYIASAPEELNHFWINREIFISEQHDRWWVRYPGVLGEDEYDSQEEALDVVYWEERLKNHLLEEVMLKKSGLESPWKMGSGEICFEAIRGDHHFSIEGVTSNPSPAWTIWCDDSQITNRYYPSPREAFQIIQQTSEWNQNEEDR